MDKPEFRVERGPDTTNEILRVTPDGEFIWHDNADKLIETGDFSGSPAMPHILRRLRQRDALLEALKLAWPIIEAEKLMQDGCYGKNFSQSRVERARKAYEATRAAIAAVEGEKT